MAFNDEKDYNLAVWKGKYRWSQKRSQILQDGLELPLGLDDVLLLGPSDVEGVLTMEQGLELCLVKDSAYDLALHWSD